MTVEQGERLAEAQTIPEKPVQPAGPFKPDGFQHYYLRAPDDIRPDYKKCILRVAEGTPIAVVAIGPGTEVDKIVRGISICSDVDQWDRSEGRKIAVGRCRRALGLECSTQSILMGHALVPHYFYRWYRSVYGDDHADIMKSAYNVVPTKKEAKILANMLRKDK